MDSYDEDKEKEKEREREREREKAKEEEELPRIIPPGPAAKAKYEKWKRTVQFPPLSFFLWDVGWGWVFAAVFFSDVGRLGSEGILLPACCFAHGMFCFYFCFVLHKAKEKEEEEEEIKYFQYAEFFE